VRLCRAWPSVRRRRPSCSSSESSGLRERDPEALHRYDEHHGPTSAPLGTQASALEHDCNGVVRVHGPPDLLPFDLSCQTWSIGGTHLHSPKCPSAAPSSLRPERALGLCAPDGSRWPTPMHQWFDGPVSEEAGHGHAIGRTLDPSHCAIVTLSPSCGPVLGLRWQKGSRGMMRRPSSASTSFVLALLRGLHVDPSLPAGAGARQEPVRAGRRALRTGGVVLTPESAVPTAPTRPRSLPTFLSTLSRTRVAGCRGHPAAARSCHCMTLPSEG
jgi:hypothetical protein